MKIALAGNPNSGKTTLFNAITGKMEYVGNWPGVTVEKKIANLKRAYKNIPQSENGGSEKFRKGPNRISVVDLPGAYSIAPYTGEEAITRDFVIGEQPDVIINIIDSTSLERSLFFTTQLLELGVPVVVALNKQDILSRQGITIDSPGLAGELGCPVVEIVANRGQGLKDLLSAAIETAKSGKQKPPQFAGQGQSDEDRARQNYISELTGRYRQKELPDDGLTVSDKIDRVVANPLMGLPIFALIMWAIYAFSISGLGGWLSEYINEVLFAEVIPNGVNNFFESIGVHQFLSDLIVEGAIGGVGAVLGFLPLIMVLFFCLALLEDSGYMARVALVMDRYFKKIGLSGKSIIPMIVGTGCSIPGIMATRTIENRDEKIATVMLTPFVPCGAKLPVIALLAAVFFPGSAWIFPAIYLLAGLIIIAAGLLLKKIFNLRGDSSFILELPEYKVPSVRHALRQMFHQAKSFIVKASTIILVMNTLVWFMQSYNWQLQLVEDQSASVLASIGSIAAPLLVPLGIIGWQAAAASLTGFVAKENVVATFGVILAASEETLHVASGPLSELFTPLTAFSFLAFNLFIPPCFAAIGAMNAEFLSRRWLGRTIFFQFAVGYSVAMLINQIGTPLIYGHLAAGFFPALIIAAALTALSIYLIFKNGKEKLPQPLSCCEGEGRA